MAADVKPEPSSEEREAIEEALARLLGERPDPRSDWWRAGIRERLTREGGRD